MPTPAILMRATFSLFLWTRRRPGMTINSVTGLIQWTPARAHKSMAIASLCACRTQGGLFATQSLYHTGQRNAGCSAADHYIHTGDYGTVGRLVSYNVDATDPDAGDTITYSLNGAPVGHDDRSEYGGYFLDACVSPRRAHRM